MNDKKLRMVVTLSTKTAGPECIMHLAQDRFNSNTARKHSSPQHNTAKH